MKSLMFAFFACYFKLAMTEPELDVSMFYPHADPQERVVGGTRATEGSHPHLGALYTGRNIKAFFCGGSVLTSRTVLTAAHCITAFTWYGELDNTLHIRLGSIYWNEGGVSYSFSHNVTHPENYEKELKDDIAILVTTTMITMTDLIKPVAMNFDYQDQGVIVKTAGWGRLLTGGLVSKNLIELEMMTISGNNCLEEAARVSKTFNIIVLPIKPESHICSFRAKGLGLCDGDSGSALTRSDNGQLIGVVSWGFPCAIGAPDIFVRLSAYKDWLEKVIV